MGIVKCMLRNYFMSHHCTFCQFFLPILYGVEPIKLTFLVSLVTSVIFLVTLLIYTNFLLNERHNT